MNNGERKHIKVNGILLDNINEKYPRCYLNNIRGRTSRYFDETMFRNIKPGDQWIVTNENGERLGYIQNIRNYNTKYYIFIGEKLLSTANFWPEVEKFISSLDNSIRISYHPDWNGICWNGIKDEKRYLLIYDDNEIMFKSEGCSVPFRSDKDWNEVKVIDVKDNLKQIAKSMNTVTFKTNNPRSVIPVMTKDERENGTPVNEFNQVITINCNEGVETICTFKEALNEKNVYVKSLANEPIGEIRNKKVGTLSLKHILEFDHKDEVIRYVEANINRESVVLVQFNGICPQAPVMKYEEFKKQTSKFVRGSKWDYKCLNRVQKIQLFQLFPTVKFIGLFNVNEAKRFLTELN